MSYLADIDLSQVFCKDPSGTGVVVTFQVNLLEIRLIPALAVLTYHLCS